MDKNFTLEKIPKKSFSRFPHHVRIALFVPTHFPFSLERAWLSTRSQRGETLENSENHERFPAPVPNKNAAARGRREKELGGELRHVFAFRLTCVSVTTSLIDAFGQRDEKGLRISACARAECRQSRTSGRIGAFPVFVGALDVEKKANRNYAGETRGIESWKTKEERWRAPVF